MINKKIAIITGITGQDAPYLAKLLLEKNYKVIGILRESFSVNLSNLDYLGIKSKVIFETCDLSNMASVINILNKYNPDEFYNLASQSSVGLSFAKPTETLSFNINSVINILEAIRITNNKIRFYQASSSEIFGDIDTLPIKETTVFNPVSPYGISKASAHWIVVNYRKAYGLYTTSGILFNHESVLRSNDFIIKKVIKTAIDIKDGKQDILEVGNIDIKRDFGYAPNYVEAMYLMMQKEKSDDYIICSGKSVSLKEIIYYIFDYFKLDKNKIVVNEKFIRPNEIKDIYGNSSKAKQILNWNYDLDFFEVLDIIINEELKR